MTIEEKTALITDEKNKLKALLQRKNISDVQFQFYHIYFQRLMGDYFISPNGLDTNDGKTVNTPFLTLKKAIDVATEGANIIIMPGTYKGDGVNCNLTINKSINLYGETECVFDGEASYSAGFVISANYTVNIYNLIFQNSKNDVITANGVGEIRDCFFYQNTANTIFYNNGGYNIINCVFKNNTTIDGALATNGVITNNSNGNIIGCMFMNNVCDDGAICFLAGTTSTAGISFCDFYNNKVNNIYNLYQNGTIIHHCYWDTQTPMESDYGYVTGSIIINNVTSANHPEWLTDTSISLVANVTSLNLSEDLPVVCTAHLQNKGENMNGVTISFYNDDILLGTATTDLNGIAEFSYKFNDGGIKHIKVISPSGAIYDSVTSAIVNVVINDDLSSVYIIDDSGAVDNSATLFDATLPLRNNGKGAVYYDETNKHYILSRISSSAQTFFPLPALTGKNQITIECDGYVVAESSGGNSLGFVAYKDAKNWCSGYFHQTSSFFISEMTGGTLNRVEDYNTLVVQDLWYHYVFTINNKDITFSVQDSTGAVLTTKSRTLNDIQFDTNLMFGFTNGWALNNNSYVKNIKAYTTLK